jgi:diguanylate cyclase (GGDEF)-like protein/PAS domain S-box-containing protein
MDMKLHPVTLKFSGASSHLETPFRRYYYRGSIIQLRIILFGGVLFYALFGILDALLMPELKYTIWLIRLIVICPVFLLAVLLLFEKHFERYMQPVLTALLLLAGGGIVCMTAVAPIPVNYYYYAGIILILLYGYTFISVRFLWASSAGLIIVILYEITATWINPVPFSVLMSNSFFLLSANIAGMMACYSIESYARRDFFMKKQLESEKENVRKINEELEERVRQRTMDYQIINRALKKEVAGHKKAEEAVRSSEEKYRALVENANDLVFRTDKKGQFVFVNVSTVGVTGYDENELLGKSYLFLVRPDMHEEALQFFSRQIKNGIRNTYSEYPVVKKDGSEIWLGQNTQLIIEDGNVKGFQAVSRDVTERRRLERELKASEERYRELSIVDDLTQLYNSRHFYNQLKMEIGRIERREYPLTLLLLDIDDFKVYNDTYGHIEGDNVLFRLGQIIKRCLRKEDSAYRYGGEEFTIILPMTTKEEGLVTAERIREELKKENFSPKSDKEIYLTVSIGLAQYKKNEDMKPFVNRADHLMYKSKKNGKDQICCG